MYHVCYKITCENCGYENWDCEFKWRNDFKTTFETEFGKSMECDIECRCPNCNSFVDFPRYFESNKMDTIGY